MINSILGRHKALVILNNITHKNYNTMEPKEIKQEIKEHFRKWTKYNPKNEATWEGWKARYEPKEEINNNWYEGVEQEISMEELKEIITEAPSGKTIEPSEVSNEIIKRLGTKATEHMLKIMNICMKLQTVPKS